MSVKLAAALLLSLVGTAGLAATPKGAKPKQKLDLGLPKSFGALPTGEDLEKPKEKS